MNPSLLGQRFRSYLRHKVAAGLIMVISIGGPYFALQYIHFFSITLMPQLAIDRAIRFIEVTVWLYLSMYVLLPLSVLMINRLDLLRRYTLGAVMIGLSSGLIFLFFPTEVDRISPDEAEYWVYKLLISIDRPVNACPSLHASLCVFAAITCHGMLRHAPRRRFWQAGLWIWTIGILYATISTRQHVFIDIAAGVVLAWIAYALVVKLVPLDQIQSCPSSHAPK